MSTVRLDFEYTPPKMETQEDQERLMALYREFFKRAMDRAIEKLLEEEKEDEG